MRHSPKVFISYRRGDDRYAVGRIRSELVRRYGSENIFLDVSSLRSGENYSSSIASYIPAADALLVVIGHQWEALSAKADDDYVAVEVEIALSANTRIIPVLLGDRAMPNATALPGVLGAIARLNAHRIRPDPDFDADLEELVHQLDRRKQRSMFPRIALGVAAAMLLVAAFTAPRLYHRADNATEVREEISDAPTQSPFTTDLRPTTTTLEVSEFFGTWQLPESLPLAGPGDGRQMATLQLAGLNYAVPTEIRPFVRYTNCSSANWVARWKADGASTISADLVDASAAFDPDLALERPEMEQTEGFLAGNSCSVPAFWLVEETASSEGVEVEVEWQYYSNPAGDGNGNFLCSAIVPNNKLPLKPCDEGKGVRLAQAVLNALGWRIHVDGQFGPATCAAIDSFLIAGGRSPTSLIDLTTWKALLSGYRRAGHVVGGKDRDNDGVITPDEL